MSRLEFYIVIFRSRVTMIEHFQNNSECNIQHKVIESDTIFIHGEDHSIGPLLSVERTQVNAVSKHKVSSFPYNH